MPAITDASFMADRLLHGGSLMIIGKCCPRQLICLNIEQMCTSKVDENHVNILKKYEFSKLFINELYLNKYKNLQKHLQEIEEQKVMSLKKKENERKSKEEDAENQQSDARISSISETEEESKYNAITRNGKQQRSDYFEEEVTLLSSDTESNSEGSILEVPIPPKPQPPVINLQDSDEGASTSSSHTDTDTDCLFRIEGKNNSTKMNEKTLHTCIGKATHIDNRLINHTTEDIVLNCTDIQKGLSSIKEIKEISKQVQNKSIESNNEDQNSSVRKTKKSLSTSEKNNIPEYQLPLEPINNSNIVYERDKQKLISSMEDVTNFETCNQASSSRKRQRENDNEAPVATKQKKHSYTENICSEVNPDQHVVKGKINPDSWEEYFFRPMPDNLKKFYNESRGQENFSVQEAQSKMSKDPRLWAILDEDLMPNLSRQKCFWNVKCNNCNQAGHQSYNCSEPYKPLRCRMCGTQGHTETRCPQKMCLTCGKKQGTFRKTCDSCRTLYCGMCRAVGHKSTECPDHWRKFHQTTRSTDINIPENLSEVMKPADLLYCCNCTKRGHDFSTCHEYRWSQHFPTPVYVSNYRNESRNVGSMNMNIGSADIIPLTKRTKTKNQHLKNVTFYQGLDNLKGCPVLYSYGTFHTNKPDGEEIKRRLSLDVARRVEYFLKDNIAPPFFESLMEIVKFELMIFRISQKVLLIRIRSTSGIAMHIYEIFIFWLKLENEDKHLNFHINLPRNYNKLVTFLNTESRRWKQDALRHDPYTIYDQIEKLERSRIHDGDPAMLNETAEKILNLRTKLLKIYHMRPKISYLVQNIRAHIKRLRKNRNKMQTPTAEIDLENYMGIICLYNQICIPRTLTEEELTTFLQKFYKFVNKLQSNSKSKAVQLQRNTNLIDTATLSKVTSKQSEETPIVTSTEMSSTSNIQLNDNVRKSNTGPVVSEECNIEEVTIAAITPVYPTTLIQIPCSEDTSNDKVKETVEQVQQDVVLSNVIAPSLEKPSCSYRISQQLNNNDQLKCVPSTEKKNSEHTTQEDTGTMKSNNNITATNLQQENTINLAVNVATKKKKKKAKMAKPHVENNSQVKENEMTNVDVSIENKAQKVITEALEFNSPYMNKAVEEIHKRISDRNIKQEHIDVLQRLINLEKEHRQYVSSFCNYLK
ncbi:PREDICTED: uncharacterized protein LOC107190432 [Dufourea novaeangliae]|uniref:uncharacterized protein LOC107190432 n=1 Tax=Dufourea novaeangliae TaxID=178035 RepID=UPI000767257F|nr:PREDICTED: uncharacterized protein LOC107190432 [Dufourea novaeangliae]